MKKRLIQELNDIDPMDFEKVIFTQCCECFQFKPCKLLPIKPADNYPEDFICQDCSIELDRK